MYVAADYSVHGSAGQSSAGQRNAGQANAGQATGQGSVATDSDELGLQGRLDASRVREARARLYQLIESTAGDVVVDLSMVDVIDAAGLGVLAGAHRRMERSNRHLILRGCGSRLRCVLARTRLMRVMHIEPARAAM